MKKLISFLTLSILFAGLMPQMALAYTGVNLANTEPDAVYSYNDNGMFGMRYTDETTDAQDTGTADVTLLTDLDDVFYIGFSEMFDGISMLVSTPVDGYKGSLYTDQGQYDVEYWNGTSWDEFSFLETLRIVNYDIKNHPTDGVFSETWAMPTDWATTTVNSSSSLYYARLSFTEAYTADAVVSQIGIIDYNLKIEVRDEFGDGIEDMVEGDFTIEGNYGTDDTIYHFEEIGDGVYGFALDAPISTDPEYNFSIFPDGYVGKDPARENVDLDFSEYLFESEDHAFAYVFMLKNGAGEDVDPVSAMAGLANVTCTVDDNDVYCPVKVSHDGTGTDATIYADGYLAKQPALGDRTTDTAAQIQTTLTMEYGYTATVKNDNGDLITNATLMSGDDYDVQCNYIGSGVYGCPISISDADPLVRITADGYETFSSSFSTQRTDHSSAQVSTTFILEEGESTVDDGTDSDGDGLTDVEEATLGTDPTSVDTDGDGAEDGTEVDMGTDPNDATDFLANYPDYEEECAHPFDDTRSHWAEESICALYSAGVVEGRSGSEYEPNMSVTRAEFLKIALLNAGLTVTADASYTYTDVDESDWYYEYVTYATAEGYVEGYDDGSFRPNSAINRAEAMSILMNIAGVVMYDVMEDDIEFDDVDVDDWFAWAVVAATDENIVEGYDDDTFRPGNNITRAETAVIARRAWFVYYE